MFTGLVRVLCEKLSYELEVRHILRKDNKPYLDRYRLFKRAWVEKYLPAWLANKLPNVYLHNFLSSDQDLELHNHPWGTSLSLILVGGYSEERRTTLSGIHGSIYAVSKKNYTPGSLNFIRANDFHRVDLLEDQCWSLFITGERQQDWGFWNRDTQKYTPWRLFHGLD